MRGQVLLPLMIACAATALTGCGSSAPQPYNPPVAPPGTAFSDSTLNGTYVVAFSGTDISGGYYESFFAVAGTLVTNGAGAITSGTIDLIDPALGTDLGAAGYTFTRVPVTGTYTVTADGRGSGTLSMTIDGNAATMGLDFAMASSSHGLITRFDNGGSGSGTLDAASGVSQSALAGSYAFGLDGVDSTVQDYLSTAGAVTLDANGSVTSGVQDFSDNGNASNLQALAVQGNVTAGTPGTAQLATSAASFGTLHFDAWFIDPTHFKLIETDSTALLAGDAHVSTGHTAFPSGQLAFTLSGADTAQGPFASGGILTSDGSSRITGGLEDVNDQGDVAESPNVTGSLTSSGPRTSLTLDGIYNGYFEGNTPFTGNYTFAAYPFNGGVVLLEIDNGAGTSLGISGGDAFVQSATSLNSAAGYALNLSGANSGGEADMIAEFTTSASGMSGIYDANDLGFLISDASLGPNGIYSAGSSGTGTAQFPDLQTTSNSYAGELYFTYYVVDDSSAILLETDPGQTATGVLLLQGGSSSPSVTLFHTLRVSGFSSPRHEQIERRP
ncbi:MAG: hypothetical protein WAM21_00010 [Steroidobacteraceae bacterium]